MLKNQLDALNADVNRREGSSWLHKLLPVFLVLSFVWLGVFENYSLAASSMELFGTLGGSEGFGDLFFSNAIIGGLIDWLWFEIVFYIFKLFCGFSVFTYTIPKNLFVNKARLFMVIRNLIFGAVMNAMFFIPQFIASFYIVIELIIDMLVFLWFVFAVTKETVDIMIKPNVYRVLVTSFVIIRSLALLSLVVGVL